ncbi:MAG: cytochrome c biogenesis protein CcdA [Flavobacteriaceae bacterium]
MKKLLLFIALIGIIFTLKAQGISEIGGKGQIKDPIEWEGAIKKINDSEYELSITGYIDDNWHVYSQHTPNEGIGPIPLEIDFPNSDKDFSLEGPLNESETHRAYSDVWGFDEVYFSETAILTQKIKLANPETKVIKAELFYQVCIDVCLNETRYIVFDLALNEVKFIENFDDFEGYSSKESAKTQVEESKKNDINRSSESGSKEEKESKGLWVVFIFAFLSGFAALLTPCVFPMIPLTVSFFTKQSKSKAQGIRNAIIYGLAIIVIYVVLGLAVSVIFGADALNQLSTDPWFNLIFFILLVVFAVSFLGAFEIVLPNSWANKVDSKADKGGIVGILFMALALAIVSFSCTGPLVGAALVTAATTGNYFAPIISMFGFSLAIALPFGLFAAFPGWMNSLPKSGGWLNTVKVFLGFLELALAFKFLSMADLAWKLHYIERETFIAIWIAVFGVLALYLFGKIKLPHDSPLPHISVGRLLLGIVTLTFVIYLIPGLWGAPLKIISGFPPPIDYSESPYGVGFKKLGSSSSSHSDGTIPDGAHLMKPYDIVSFNDYEVGLKYAKKMNKPVLLDFTGINCVNCRKMEENVWTDERILPMLKNDIVLISLYVDDKEKLPKEDRYTSETTGKRIKTIGNKWSDFQIKKYRANAQPYYVLIDMNEKNLNTPIGYMPDVEEYGNWLKGGIKKFK